MCIDILLIWASFRRTFSSIDILNMIITVAGEIYGLKSVAAYRSGLNINTNISEIEAEVGLRHTIDGKHCS